MDDQPLKGQPVLYEAAPRITRRRHWVRTGVVALLVLLLVAAALWYLTPSGKGPGGPGGRFAANGPAPVGVATVTQGDMPIVRQALGTVTPLATVTLKTQISGTIVDIAFKEGQTVNRGDYLLEIDPRPYQVALQQARGTLARDQALLANARIDLNRYRQLIKQDSIAEQTVATQEALVRQDEGTVLTDQGAVASAELNLAYCHIVSPISGRIGLRLVDLGNYVTPGDATGLVVLTQVKPITVVFTLPEDDVQQVIDRLHAGAVLPVTAYDRNRTEKLAEGTLAAIDSQIDVTTGTLKLKASFANDDERLFPAQFVNVDLLLDKIAGATLVPQAAIQTGAPGSYAYVLDPAASTVSVQVVKTGPGNANVVSITDGLKPGQTVVVDGVDRLKSGDKVVVADGKTAPGAAGPAAKGGAHRRRKDGDQPPASGAAPAAPAPSPQ